MSNLVSASTFNRAWRYVTHATWDTYMLDASPQLTDALPRGGRSRKHTDSAGSCCVQAFSETMTGHLRIWHEERSHQGPAGLQNQQNAFEVNLLSMIHCTAGHGVLTRDGSSVYNVGRLGQVCGIPLKGNVPYAGPLPEENHPIYALGTSIAHYPAIPLPSGTPTAEQIEEAMAYREHICACLDAGPVVVFLRAQPHYFQPGRPAHEPYRRINYTISEMLEYRLRTEDVRGAGHCVSVFGYHCPTGDVSSLVLNYQENALKERESGDVGLATTGGLADRHIMDPDAIEYYYVPNLDNLRFSSRPGVARFIQSKPRTTSLWDDIKAFMTT